MGSSKAISIHSAHDRPTDRPTSGQICRDRAVSGRADAGGAADADISIFVRCNRLDGRPAGCMADGMKTVI